NSLPVCLSDLTGQDYAASRAQGSERAARASRLSTGSNFLSRSSAIPRSASRRAPIGSATYQIEFTVQRLIHSRNPLSYLASSANSLAWVSLGMVSSLCWFNGLEPWGEAAERKSRVLAV